MKNIIFVFAIFMMTTNGYGQLSVGKIIKPNAGQCDGTIVLNFIESELSGTLLVIPSNQGQSGGSISINNTSHTLNNLCEGGYTFIFKDNHECKASEFVDLEACPQSDFNFNVETNILNCNLDAPFSIYPDFEDFEDYYFEWSTGSIKNYTDKVTNGLHSVTVTDEFGCTTIEQISIDPLECQNSMGFKVETKVEDCDFENIFSIVPDFTGFEEYCYKWSNGYKTHSIQNVSAGEYSVTFSNVSSCLVYDVVIEPIEIENEIEIVPTKIEMARNGNLGVVEIEIEGGNPPFQFEWSSSDVAALGEVAEDGLSATLKYIDYKSDITVSVTDNFGCTTEEIITLETCFGMDSDDFDVFFNPFEVKKCSDLFEGEMYFDVQMISSFVNYKILKLDGNMSWELFKEGVVKQDAPSLTFMYSESGKYKISFWDECGFTYEKEITLNCKDDELNCSGLKDLIQASTYNVDDDCDQDDPIFRFNLWKLHKYCIEEGNQYNYSYCTDPIEVLIKFSDGATYRVTANEFYLYDVETIVESEDVYINPDTKDLIFKGNPNKIHNVEVALPNGCILMKTIDVRTDEDESNVWLVGLDNVNGMCAQAMNVKCKTCKKTIYYPKEFTYDYYYNENIEGNYGVAAYNDVCDDPVLSSFTFVPELPTGWDETWGTSPFDYGGTYKMTLGSGSFWVVTIPEGTPYVYVSPEQGHPSHSGSNWIRCLYAAGYASSPAFSDKPVYVGYSQLFLDAQIIYTFEPPTILDEDCEDEWITTSVEFCKKDVLCLDTSPATVIGTVADESSLIPCKLQTSSGCIVIGYCTESQDYYYDDDGEYFVYEDLDCDDDDVMDCVEDTNNEPPIVCDEEHPCPGGQFCLFNKCRDCPIFSFAGIYGNNNDCYYDFEISFQVDVAIFGVKVKTFTIGPDGNEKLEHTLYMNFGPGGLLKKIKVEIPPGCIETNVRITLEYKNCMITEVLTTEAVTCSDDCFGTNNDDDETSLKIFVNQDPVNNIDLVEAKPKSEISSLKDDCILYPNPFLNVFKIESKSKIINSSYIISALGENSISNNKIFNRDYIFDLSEYPSGIYFVRLIFEDGSKKEFKALKI